MVNQLTLGEKIRYYRKRKSRSQLDLELDIQAAPGTLSRIERDTVNPTKETMMKIGGALDLDPREIAVLFGINLL